MKTGKLMSVFAAMIMAASTLTGCGGSNSEITVISREDGSGTR